MSEHRDTLLLYLRVNYPGRNTKGIFNKCLLMSVLVIICIISFYSTKQKKRKGKENTSHIIHIGKKQ